MASAVNLQRKSQSTRPAFRVFDEPYQADPDSLDLKRRSKLFRQFGDFTIAWSTVVQPGLRYFGNDTGYLAFASKWGIDFALGDPVAPPETHRDLINAFMESRRRLPCFVNCMESTARIVAENPRYYLNQLGIDTVLHLDEYDFRGKSKEPLRYAANWLARRGYQVQERDFQGLDPQQVKALSQKWRSTRTIKDREVGFLNRPLVLEDEPGVRKFFLFDADENLTGFVFLDPIWQDGRIVGYSTSIKRRDPAAPGYAEQGIMKHCIDVLKDEGIETVRLGLSPLATVDVPRFAKRNPLLNWSWNYGFRARWVNRWFYNVRGHAEFKKRFRGEEHPVWFASPALFNDYRVIAMLRLMRVF